MTDKQPRPVVRRPRDHAHGGPVAARPRSVVRRKLSDLRETAAVIEPATLELAADA